MRNWQVIAKTMAELTKDVVKALREDGYRGRTVTLKIRFGDSRHTRGPSASRTRRFRGDHPPHGLRVFEKSRAKEAGEIDGVRVSNLEKKKKKDVDRGKKSRYNRSSTPRTAFLRRTA